MRFHILIPFLISFSIALPLPSRNSLNRHHDQASPSPRTSTRGLQLPTKAANVDSSGTYAEFKPAPRDLDKFLQTRSTPEPLSDAPSPPQDHDYMGGHTDTRRALLPGPKAEVPTIEVPKTEGLEAYVGDDPFFPASKDPNYLWTSGDASLWPEPVLGDKNIKDPDDPLLNPWESHDVTQWPDPTPGARNKHPETDPNNPWTSGDSTQWPEPSIGEKNPSSSTIDPWKSGYSTRWPKIIPGDKNPSFSMNDPWTSGDLSRRTEPIQGVKNY